MLTTPKVSISDLFIEHAPKLEARRGYMFPADKQHLLETRKDAGFRSVYMFSKDDAEAIQRRGSSKGFNNLEVYADRLFIDLDGGDAELELALKALWGYGFHVYSSGSKGYHIELPHKPYFGAIPEAHLEWVTNNHTPHDASIYKRSSIIALPGRKHPTTGRKKELIMTFVGKEPEFKEPKLQRPKIVETVTELSFVLMRAARLAENEPVKGGRQTALWSLAQSLADAGLAKDTTLDIVRKVNEQWDSPKPDSEILRAVSAPYQKLRL